MDFNPHCFNTYNNLSSRQKASTFQATDKNYILRKFFENQKPQTNYANVVEHPEPPTPMLLTPTHHMIPNNHHHRQISRHSHHSRTQQLHHSQSHYYQTMHHHQQYHHPSANDPSNYYNLNNGVPHQLPITRSRHSFMNEPMMSSRPPLDSITVMQVCNELGKEVDTTPPMPESRKYSIFETAGCLFKVPFPQTRVMQKNFPDPRSGTSLTKGETIWVVGPSKEDRSKLTVYRNHHPVDVPHQYTQAPPIPPMPYNPR